MHNKINSYSDRRTTRLFCQILTAFTLSSLLITAACTPEHNTVRSTHAGKIHGDVSPFPLFIDHRLLDTSSFSQSWYVTYLLNYERARPASGSYSGNYQDFSCVYCIQGFTADLTIDTVSIRGVCSFTVSAFDNRRYRAAGSVMGFADDSGQLQFDVRGSVDTSRTQEAGPTSQLEFRLHFRGQAYRYYYGHNEAEHGPYYSIVGTLRDELHKLLPDGVMSLTSITTH